jgi:hypothetical protein
MLHFDPQLNAQDGLGSLTIKRVALPNSLDGVLYVEENKADETGDSKPRVRCKYPNYEP